MKTYKERSTVLNYGLCQCNREKINKNLKKWKRIRKLSLFSIY